ncbi:hypothetical protein ABK040_000229 [Willaertia magna]
MLSENFIAPEDRKTIVVLGAAGRLGHLIVDYILRKRFTYSVHMIVTTHELKLPEVQLLKEKGALIFNHDFDLSKPLEAHPKTYQFLKSALYNAKVVISCLSSEDRNVIPLIHKNIFTLMNELKIPRFVPSDFCVDYRDMSPGDYEIMEYKLRTWNSLQLLSSNGSLEFTSILCGCWMQMFQEPWMRFVNIHKGEIFHWGEGNEQFQVTSIDDVAAFTVDCVTNFYNETKNKFCGIVGDTITMTNLRDSFSKIMQKDFRLIKLGELNDLDNEIKRLKEQKPVTFVKHFESNVEELEQLKMMLNDKYLIKQEDLWNERYEKERDVSLITMVDFLRNTFGGAIPE